MYRKLSIIIPCYNSEETLEEAVLSINTQNFNMPYEVVIVNDGSTDKTELLISTLAQKNPNIKHIKHKENKGGAIAFNTAIENSTGDVIFCLDSDNILVPDTLPKMFTYLNEKKADGVAFSEQRFFFGKNKEKYKSQTNNLGGRPVLLEDLLKPNAVLLDQFMMSKTSYYEVGGHPLHHGFTGQSFEVKFVSQGKKVYFCPDTSFYHRNADKKSWFERVYETGVFSKNFYLILEEIMHLLSPQIRLEILKYDIYKNANLFGDNIKHMVVEYTKVNQNVKILSGNAKYMNTDGWYRFYTDHKNSEDPADVFCLAIYFYWQKEYDKSLEYYKDLLRLGFDTPVVYFNILRNLMSISAKYSPNSIEEESDKVLTAMALHPQPPIFKKEAKFTKVARRGKRFLKKWISFVKQS